MSRGFGGGWRGVSGGMMRTYGLQRQFESGDGEGPKPDMSRAALKRIVHYFGPYWLRWLLILACIAAGSGLSVLQPLVVREIINNAIKEANQTLLVVLSLSVVGVAVVAGLVGVLQETQTARVVQSILYDIRNQMYRHLQRMSLHFYTANRSGEIVSRINNDVNAVQHVTAGTVVSIASNLATLAATSIAMLSMNWRLTLLAVTVVPLFYMPARIVGRIRRRLSTQTQEAQANLLAFISERLHVGGLLLTNLFGQRQIDAEGFSGRSGAVRELHIRQSIVGRWLFMTLTIFASAGPAMVWMYGGLQAMKGTMEVGDLVAFTMLLGGLYRPLTQLTRVYVDVQGAFAVFERIFEYLDLTPEVQDPPAPAELPVTRGHVVFENVTFAYPTAPRQVAPTEPNAPAEPPATFALQDVSFEIEPGQRVALVGPSGAGKTTVTYLVPRFYDPQAGRILLDGHDLRELGQEQLRRHIGMVTQETFLFHATLRENLLYARPDATEAQLTDACRAANIHDFIQGLPEGYDTVVGERGFRLSGGEKQRVSIARALLKDPAILILDEATSSLDATSEYLIQTALETLLQGRTSLIIAHRLSTILTADRIVVVDRGRVQDMGRHDQLLTRGGLYAELFTQQFGQVLEWTGQARPQ